MDYVYNFVINVSNEELDYYRTTTIEENLHLFSRWGYDWCLQPYLRLKGISAIKTQLSNRMLPNCINIVHSAQLEMEIGQPDYFIVCARADFPRRNWAHFHLVQNQNQIVPNTAFIPHWVQPGLICRDKNRKSVKRIGYAGQIFNGNLAACEEDWVKLFAQHDLDFVVLPPEACFDLSQIDVLIGIRSFDTRRYNTKPASKLVNAWHAHIPFVGGHDSAFEQFGKPGVDYLRVVSKEEVLAAVLRLRNEPSLYQELTINGKNKAKQYNDETTFTRWEQVLTGPVLERYQKWQTNLNIEKKRFAYSIMVHKIQNAGKKLAKNLINAFIQRIKKQKIAG